MAQPSEKDVERAEAAHERPPQCLSISEEGIQTAQDFAKFMSAVMGDVIAGRLSASKAGAATRAGSALLKVIEMQYKYGSESDKPGKRTLRLID